MAELAGLNVVLTGDASNLTRELNNTQKTLAKTAIEASKLDSKLSKDLSQGSNTAGQSLMNLGRIAQDAPFGFIGIQNNINPLLESFTRLKAETGSTAGAFKSLVSGLAGGAGIGLAVSLATSALTILSQNGFFKSAEAADTATDSIKKYKEAISGAFEGAAKEATGVVSLIAVLKNETETRERKLAALEKLQKINPEIFNGLTLEKGAVQGLDTAYQEYIKSLSTVIAVKMKQAQIEAEIQKLLKLQGAEQTTQQKNIIKGANEFFKAEQKRVGALGGTLGNPNQVKIILQEKDARNTQQKIDDFAKQLEELSKGVEIDLKAPKKESVKAATKTVKDVIDELRLKIKELNTEEFTLNTDKAQERVSAFLSAIKELAVKFKLDPQGKIIQGLFDESKFAKLGFIVENEFAKLGVAGVAAFKSEMASLKMDEVVPIGFDIKAIEKGIVGKPDIKNFSISPTSVKEATALAYLQGKGITKGMQDGISVGISGLRFPELMELANSYKSQLEQWGESAINLTNQMSVNIFSAIGDALTNAVSGMSVGDIFAGFFKSILGSLGSGLEQLGIKMLLANKAILAVKNSLGKVPGIGASIGLIAIGAIIKGLANNIKLPGFAGGVQNFAGGLAMVGERGPELVRLPGGSDVIPNHALGGMSLGGGSQVFIPAVTLRGKDLIVAFNRANQTINRQS